MTWVQLLAATYFMVAGGPYGLEDLVHDSGYLVAVIVLLVTPVIWSLPTALMVSEFSTALPEEGGYYVWVRRAMGPFWGFQEAWLSLAASIFDMALYPTLFVLYLGHFWPAVKEGNAAWAIGIALIAACVVVNIRGVRTVGGSSVVMTVALLGPFAVLTVLALLSPPVATAERTPQPGGLNYLFGLLVAMWNYMGWDNCSTIAGEVERPQRAYPRAMIGAVLLVTLTYVLPVLAVSRTGIDHADWEDGSWPLTARTIAGPALGVAIAVGGMISGFGSFNSLVLSYSRLPVVLAEHGYLPAFFTRRHPKTGAPWVAVTVCALAWALALPLGFRHLVALDVVLYGLSLVLEFIALFVLRIYEPGLPRPFRVPGGVFGTVLVGVGPTLLLVLALLHARDEQAGRVNAVLLGAILVALGPLIYFASRWLSKRSGGTP